jgi:hypothetical protein
MKKVKGNQSSLIRINLNDVVLYNNKDEVIVKDFVVTPNGMNDPKLICIIYAQKENGNMISASSNHFCPLDEKEYDEFYPTPHLFNLK